MKNAILTNKQFLKEFLASYSIYQHLIYGIVIPMLFLISLLAWDPRVFVFIFLAYSCGMIGFLFAGALMTYEKNNFSTSYSTTHSNREQLSREPSKAVPAAVNLCNLMTAHDLKEPLRQVHCYAQLLDKQYNQELSGEGSEYLQYVLQGAKRMHQMMEDIAALNRMGHKEIRKESIDLATLLEDARQTLHLRIKDSRALITHDPLPEVKADAGQIRHLLLNLVGNALKYQGEESPEIHIGIDHQSDCIRIRVEDNGIGIAPAQLKEVFGLFRRLHAPGQFEGSGVGLAICKQIVVNHGGEIGVHSKGVGKGSTFWFTLPLTA